MTETLLQRILFLADQIESPTISRAAAITYSAEAMAKLISDGILGRKFKETLIPRPDRFGPGEDLVVRETLSGLFGVAEGDDFIEPLCLYEDDRWLYEISIQHLVDAIREDNGIDGARFRNDGGLIYIGQRSVDGAAVVDVYLSLPNSNEDSVMARCRRLEEIARGCQLALLTPRPLDIVIGDRGILATSQIVAISLMAAAGEGHLTVSLDEAFRRVAPASSTDATVIGPDPERLIQDKRHVDVATAARYLERTRDHVRRLVASETLVRIGQGRPLKISVESLRLYKGTAEAGSSKETPA